MAGIHENTRQIIINNIQDGGVVRLSDDQAIVSTQKQLRLMQPTLSNNSVAMMIPTDAKMFVNFTYSGDAYNIVVPFSPTQSTQNLINYISDYINGWLVSKGLRPKELTISPKDIDTYDWPYYESMTRKWYYPQNTTISFSFNDDGIPLKTRQSVCKILLGYMGRNMETAKIDPKAVFDFGGQSDYIQEPQALPMLQIGWEGESFTERYNVSKEDTPLEAIPTKVTVPMLSQYQAIQMPINQSSATVYSCTKDEHDIRFVKIAFLNNYTNEAYVFNQPQTVTLTFNFSD